MGSKDLRGASLAAASVLLLLALPVTGYISSDIEGGSPATEPAQSDGAPMLRLKCGIFDPLRDPLPVESGLTIDRGQGVYIVQFEGPIYPDQTAQLEEYADILGYLPDYAYAVRADPNNVDEIRCLGQVRYIGLFQPGYKLDPKLPIDNAERQLTITCFPGWDTAAMAAELAALGAKITRQDQLAIRAEATGDTALRMAFLPGVEWVQEYFPPEVDNGNAARIIKARSGSDGAYNWGTSSLWSYNPATGKYEGYIGTNFTAAVADTGVDGTHPAFTGKKVAYYAYGGTNWYDYYGSTAHGTHTAGTVLGNGAWRTTDPGTMGRYAGMAPGAGLVGQMIAGYCTILDLCQDAVQSGAVVSSNSWGGGYYGAYDSSAQEYDMLVRDADPDTAGNQSLTIVFAAGNAGAGSTIEPPATGKNLICVGATDNSNGGSIADFSSQGPCQDGRIKPDVVAPGYSLTSCWGNSAYSYHSMAGTSMSCPVVAGAALLVYDYYNSTRGALPSPAMVKNLLINGADAMSGLPYPGAAQGWGRLNMARSLINSTNRRIWTEDQRFELSTGTARNYVFNVTAAAELKISLVWTDVNGSLNANPALVNNLDLTVTAPNGTLYLGNQFQNGYSATNGSVDAKNNVEMFRMASPPSGVWTINVKGRNVPMGPQDYSLVIAGPVVNVTLASIDLGADGLLISPLDAEEGDAVTFSGRVSNLGDLPLGGVRYQFRLILSNNQSQVIGGTAFSLMPRRTDENVMAVWTASRGCYTAILEVDPFGVVAEDREDNNAVSLPFKVRGYGVSLSTSSLTVHVDPGRPTTFPATVGSRANSADTANLSVDIPPPAGWELVLSDASMPLVEGTKQSFEFTVTAPADALAGIEANVRLRATSWGNSTQSDTLDITVIVNQVYGLELTSGSSDVWVRPGVVTMVPISVLNSGNGQDGVFLSITGAPPEWQASLSESYAVVPARWHEKLSLTVVPPARAPGLFSMVLKLTAQYGGGGSASITINVTVLQLAGLELELADGPEDADPGATESFILRVRNLGNSPDPFTLSGEFPPGWPAQFIGVVPVKPGDFALVNLELEVPGDAMAGERIIRIAARSGINSSVEAELELSLLVNQVYGVGLSSGATRAAVETGNYTAFELSVNNTGNGEDLLTLSSEDSLSKGWRITFSPAQLDLPACGTALVVIKVKPASDTENGSYFFIARATSFGDSTSSAEVRFRVDVTRPAPEPVTPPVNNTRPPQWVEPPAQPKPSTFATLLSWPWSALLVLLLLVCAAAAVGVSRSRQRKRLEAEALASKAIPEAEPVPQPYQGYEAGLFADDTVTMPQTADSEEGELFSDEYQSPASAKTAWEGTGYLQPVAPPEEEAPLPEELPTLEPEPETIEMGPPMEEPQTAPRPRYHAPRSSQAPPAARTAPSPRPPRAAAARAPPTKKVDAEIEDILARISELSQK